MKDFKIRISHFQSHSKLRVAKRVILHGCEIKDFDPQILQKLLSTMSGGMAVALYTTLTGLVTSMLLKFQYFLLDSSLSQSLNHLNSEYK